MDDPILFWTAFGSLGQVAAAFATTLAVIVTLWQVRHANDKRLKLYFTDDSVALLNGGEVKRFVTLSVSNIGNRNVEIHNWGIKVSKKKNFIILLNPNDVFLLNIQKQSLPCMLKPEDSIDLVFDLALFVKNLEEESEKGELRENDKLNFYVSDGTGKRYYLKSKKTVQEYINDNQKYFN